MDYLTDGCAHDLLGEIGFSFAIRQILRLGEGGLAYFGLPCNSYTWRSKPQHARSVEHPFGCGHYAWVHAGNILGSRMCLLICLCVARNVKFFIENPDRSALCIFPYLQHLMSFAVLPQRVFWYRPWFFIISSHAHATMNTGG